MENVHDPVLHSADGVVDGETLTICLRQGSEKSRPTQFETSPTDPDTILMVFARPKKK